MSPAQVLVLRWCLAGASLGAGLLVWALFGDPKAAAGVAAFGAGVLVSALLTLTRIGPRAEFGVHVAIVAAACWWLAGCSMGGNPDFYADHKAEMAHHQLEPSASCLDCHVGAVAQDEDGGRHWALLDLTDDEDERARLLEQIARVAADPPPVWFCNVTPQ